MLRTDDEGLLPNYVVYHELIATSRPFMRNVCAIEMKWASSIMKKLEKMNIPKLRQAGSSSFLLYVKYLHTF